LQLSTFFPPRLVAILNAFLIILERNSLTLDDAGELLVTLILLLIGFSASSTKPSTTPFVERDPSLSQPSSVNGDAVPTSLLILYAVLFPALLASSYLTLQWIRTDKKDRARLLRRSIWIALSFGQAFGVALAATNVLKNAVARKRPSFFAMVNYAGYADAISTPQSSSQWATYFSKTSSIDHESNYFGSLVKVGSNVPQRIIDDAQRSFPSGHSSLSFAGLTWLAGFIRYSFKVKAGDFFSVRAAMSCLPLILAAYIAVSRVRDRKHNVDDVSIGSMIGALGAILAWTHLHNAEGRLNDELNSSISHDSSSMRPISSSSRAGSNNGDISSIINSEEVRGGGVLTTSSSTRTPTASAINSENDVKIVLQNDAATINSNSSNNITVTAAVPVERRQLINRDIQAHGGSQLNHHNEDEDEDADEEQGRSRRQWQSNRGNNNFSTLSIAPV
jgi:membrane-associated phospholipid phosphatase